MIIIFFPNNYAEYMLVPMSTCPSFQNAYTGLSPHYFLFIITTIHMQLFQFYFCSMTMISVLISPY